ncbi:hypothetical protein PCE1_002332 [Barthelona sp. PCE]
MKIRAHNRFGKNGTTMFIFVFFMVWIIPAAVGKLNRGPDDFHFAMLSELAIFSAPNQYLPLLGYPLAYVYTGRNDSQFEYYDFTVCVRNYNQSSDCEIIYKLSNTAAVHHINTPEYGISGGAKEIVFFKRLKNDSVIIVEHIVPFVFAFANDVSNVLPTIVYTAIFVVIFLMGRFLPQSNLFYFPIYVLRAAVILLCDALIFLILFSTVLSESSQRFLSALLFAFLPYLLLLYSGTQQLILFVLENGTKIFALSSDQIVSNILCNSILNHFLFKLALLLISLIVFRFICLPFRDNSFSEFFGLMVLRFCCVATLTSFLQQVQLFNSIFVRLLLGSLFFVVWVLLFTVIQIMPFKYIFNKIILFWKKGSKNQRAYTDLEFRILLETEMYLESIIDGERQKKSETEPSSQNISIIGEERKRKFSFEFVSFFKVLNSTPNGSIEEKEKFGRGCSVCQLLRHPIIIKRFLRASLRGAFGFSHDYDVILASYLARLVVDNQLHVSEQEVLSRTKKVVPTNNTDRRLSINSDSHSRYSSSTVDFTSTIPFVEIEALRVKIVNHMHNYARFFSLIFIFIPIKGFVVLHLVCCRLGRFPIKRKMTLHEKIDCNPTRHLGILNHPKTSYYIGAIVLFIMELGCASVFSFSRKVSQFHLWCFLFFATWIAIAVTNGVRKYRRFHDPWWDFKKLHNHLTASKTSKSFATESNRSLRSLSRISTKDHLSDPPTNFDYITEELGMESVSEHLSVYGDDFSPTIRVSATNELQPLNLSGEFDAFDEFAEIQEVQELDFFDAIKSSGMQFDEESIFIPPEIAELADNVCSVLLLHEEVHFETAVTLISQSLAEARDFGPSTPIMDMIDLESISNSLKSEFYTE